MANNLLTINMITREAVMLFINSNAFIQNIDRQYDNQFAQSGAKIGTSLRVRLPNDFTVRTGAAASPQDTNETNTTLVVATQQGVDMSFNSVDRTMSLDDFSERILYPAMNNLGGAVATNIMGGVEGGVSNITGNVNSGTGAVEAVTWQQVLNANAIINSQSGPTGNRKIVVDPFTEARVIGANSTLFNPTEVIGKQYTTGRMMRGAGFDWLMDQTIIKHTNGSYNGAGEVSGANQTGTQITTTALTGTLNAGDIITIEGVLGVNRVTKQSTGQLQQFVVTASTLTGATQINIYPALIPPATVNGNPTPVQYQTVTTSPLNGADIKFALGIAASATFRKNVAYAKEAVTMATADLVMPKGVHEAARETYDGISLRMVTQYDIGTDQYITRTDVLYGYLFIRPEWCVAVADTTS